MSFKLALEARGDVLNVSFGFSLCDQSTLEYRDDLTVSKLIRMSYSGSSSRRSTSGSRTDGKEFFGRLRCSGSVPGSLKSVSSIALVNPTLDLLESIHFVCHKLDENECRTSFALAGGQC
ncbi:hypothetical protein MLD38_005909 [Melastoma candidum]|uniref:Uncharacterized protein n=1 Tax=Melastoma candidum TaxID=119954 RepID=A0ACB9RKX6_9MYRT|nr:hypothetical protein MLD38_005909 [Melastoma candidum]